MHSVLRKDERGENVRHRRNRNRENRNKKEGRMDGRKERRQINKMAPYVKGI
jgi:hypothetical protein